jgi:hypothetical protein
MATKRTAAKGKKSAGDANVVAPAGKTAALPIVVFGTVDAPDPAPAPAPAPSLDPAPAPAPAPTPAPAPAPAPAPSLDPAALPVFLGTALPPHVADKSEPEPIPNTRIQSTDPLLVVSRPLIRVAQTKTDSTLAIKIGGVYGSLRLALELGAGGASVRVSEVAPGAPDLFVWQETNKAWAIYLPEAMARLGGTVDLSLSGARDDAHADFLDAVLAVKDEIIRDFLGCPLA